MKLYLYNNPIELYISLYVLLLSVMFVVLLERKKRTELVRYIILLNAQVNSIVDFYRPQTKLREGNVFTHVCDSVHKGGGGISVRVGLCPGDLCPGGLYPVGVSVRGSLSR